MKGFFCFLLCRVYFLPEAVMSIFEQNDHEDEEDREFNEHVKKYKKVLDMFEKDLGGLSEKTRDAHLSNACLFVNDFFYRYEIKDLEDGATSLFSFFDFFNDKCMWSTPYNVRQMCASIKKFYKSMYAHGEVDNATLQVVLDTVKENLNEWVQNSEDSLSWGSEDDSWWPFEDEKTPELKEMERQFSVFKKAVKKETLGELFVKMTSDFLFEYLSGKSVDNIHDGIGEIGSFLDGYAGGILSSFFAESIRMFYRCMLLNEEINKGEYAEVFDSLIPHGIMPQMKEGEETAGVIETTVMASKSR